MKFTLNKVKKIAEDALTLKEVGHSLLDEKYNWYKDLVGHENPYYRFMYLLTKELKPKLFVELGSYRATASSHAAYGNPDGQVVTIDIHREDADAQRDTIETAGYFRNLSYINGWADEVVDQVEKIGKPIEILFHDAWHDYEHISKDWKVYSKLLAPGALVIIDDVFDAGGIFQGMEQFWDELPGQKFLNNQLHPGIPMGFVKMPIKRNKK